MRRGASARARTRALFFGLGWRWAAAYLVAMYVAGTLFGVVWRTVA
jgi:hypothetical protein